VISKQEQPPSETRKVVRISPGSNADLGKLGGAAWRRLIRLKTEAGKVV